MSFETMNALIGSLSALLIQAEHAPNADERADAIKQLKAIQLLLESDLKTAEAAMSANTKSKVEVAAVKAAATTLASEISLIEAAEAMRKAKQLP